MIRIQQLKLPLSYNEKHLRAAVCKKLRIPDSDLQEVHIRKQSVDARKKPELHYVLTVDVKVLKEKAILKKLKDVTISIAHETGYQMPESGTEQLRHRPVICGFGPAGMFCGLLLARAGYRPLILERGEAVEQRMRSVEQFWNTGMLNPESNIQFGEGGAGTFSDGKLNTMVKDQFGRNQYVLRTFAEAGADSHILYVNKPHIGTDVLQKIVTQIREEITELGGEVRFGARVTDLCIEGGILRGMIINDAEKLDCEALILAIGHSARDTFAMLDKRKVSMQPKSFAVGLRIEHPQSMINVSQYGKADVPELGAAPYKLTGKSGQRGVYSFCMCPGGYVVNASSEAERIAVNGMSYHDRGGRNANSAMVVTVTPKDFGHPGVLGGVEFQRDLEHYAWQAGAGRVPVQLFGDFLANRSSTDLGEVQPCIKGGYTLTNLREGLPRFLGDALAEGITGFGRLIEGFDRPDAVCAGVESRTSSPVRISRDDSFVSNISGLYPCGEGAGYAGGITSAAMDGMKVAEAVIKKYRNF